MLAKGCGEVHVADGGEEPEGDASIPEAIEHFKQVAVARLLDDGAVDLLVRPEKILNAVRPRLLFFGENLLNHIVLRAGSGFCKDPCGITLDRLASLINLPNLRVSDLADTEAAARSDFKNPLLI